MVVVWVGCGSGIEDFYFFVGYAFRGQGGAFSKIMIFYGSLLIEKKSKEKKYLAENEKVCKPKNLDFDFDLFEGKIKK